LNEPSSKDIQKALFQNGCELSVSTRVQIFSVISDIHTLMLSSTLVVLWVLATCARGQDMVFVKDIQTVEQFAQMSDDSSTVVSVGKL
jgi:hypothetical protein